MDQVPPVVLALVQEALRQELNRGHLTECDQSSLLLFRISSRNPGYITPRTGWKLKKGRRELSGSSLPFPDEVCRNAGKDEQVANARCFWSEERQIKHQQ